MAGEREPGANPFEPLPAEMYAPPPLLDEAPRLATRGSRFWARTADNLLLVVAVVPGFFFGTVASDAPLDDLEVIFFGVLTGGPFWLWQMARLAATGQTLGKKALGIRVVRDGEPPGWVHGVLVREVLVQGGLRAVCSGIGGLVDALAIFGEDRRCVHDHLAGTRVVVA